MYFIKKVSTISSIAIIFAAAIGLSFAAHATIGLANWLAWGVAYALVPLVIVWCLAPLFEDDVEPYSDDLIGYNHQPAGQASESMTDYFSAIMIIMSWPVVICIAISLATIVALVSGAGKFRHKPAGP